MRFNNEDERVSDASFLFFFFFSLKSASVRAGLLLWCSSFNFDENIAVFAYLF